MTDLSEYASKISSEDDRTLFSEAVVCASHDATRGAYILIWIACAEGLKHKFNEASTRDGEAKKYLGKITQAENQHKSADMLILSYAKSYGFINDVVFQRLEHIYNMRCIYGHPYEAAPGEEELKDAANTVVQEVLSKPTLFRHGFVQTLVNNLFTDVHYLQNSVVSIRKFARDIIVRIDPTVYPYLIEQYVKKIESSDEDPTLSTLITRGAVFLSEALTNIGCGFYTPEQWHDFVAKYPNASSLIFAENSSLIEHIGADAKNYLLSHMIEASDKRPSNLKIIEGLYEAGTLPSEYEGRLKSVRFMLVRAAKLKLTTAIDQVIRSLKSHNWYSQNPAIEFIEQNSAQIPLLEEQKQEELGRNVLQAAEGEAGSAISYLHKVSENSESLPRHFLNGIVLEAFVNEAADFRLKVRCLAVILKIIKDNPYLETLIVDAIATSHPKPNIWIQRTLLDKTLNEIDVAVLPTIRDAISSNRQQYLHPPES